MSSIMEVTPQNVQSVRQMLSSTRTNPQEGYLLISGFSWYNGSNDAEFELYSNANFYNGRELTAELDHVHNRHWHLRPVPDYGNDTETASLASWFKRLKVGNNYEFNVHGQFAIGRGIWQSGGKTLYLPEVSLFPEAINQSLEHMIAQIDTKLKEWKREPCGITSKDIRRIVKYASSDLRTGKVLKHNLQAGIDADAVLGMA